MSSQADKEMLLGGENREQQDLESSIFSGSMELDHDEVAGFSRRSSRVGRFLNLPWWKVLVAFLAIWGFIDLVRVVIRLSQQPPTANTDHGDLSWYCRRDCGKTLKEAEPKGCQNFLSAGPGPDGTWLYAIDVDWTHGAESHGNINNGSMYIIDSKELVKLVKPSLTYWKKVSLSRFDGILLPMARAEEAEHSYHCTRMITNYLSKKHLTDQFKTSFSASASEKDALRLDETGASLKWL
ncbi:hypothetical protein CDEST_07799 [Colletotrichum destructivum]|uniref:Uncharacterized protein n=1 Tax=Colletotrichum destructivum TaxID=34406 RepID=A0AAX4II94_9PEZI|nr:hypothetical protein CDEST_07799 [Colletotrichum destructivum]